MNARPWRAGVRGASALAVLAALALSAPDGSSARSHHRPPRRQAALGVHAHEYRITLSRLAAPAGRIVIELDNEGQDAHDLKIAPAGSETPTTVFPSLAAGARLVKATMLTRGTYRLWCSLPGHVARGMHAVFRVT